MKKMKKKKKLKRMSIDKIEICLLCCGDRDTTRQLALAWVHCCVVLGNTDEMSVLESEPVIDPS